jgi:hypothetical protein
MNPGLLGGRLTANRMRYGKTSFSSPKSAEQYYVKTFWNLF